MKKHIENEILENKKSPEEYVADIKDITDEFVKKVESWINNYPRNIFDFKNTNMIIYI